MTEHTFLFQVLPVLGAHGETRGHRARLGSRAKRGIKETRGLQGLRVPGERRDQLDLLVFQGSKVSPGLAAVLAQRALVDQGAGLDPQAPRGSLVQQGSLGLMGRQVLPGQRGHLVYEGKLESRVCQDLGDQRAPRELSAPLDCQDLPPDLQLPMWPQYLCRGRSLSLLPEPQVKKLTLSILFFLQTFFAFVRGVFEFFCMHF